MRTARLIVSSTVLLAGAAMLSACVGPPKCETEGRYQFSQPGQRIQAPDDLDELEPYKELTVPQASPRESPDDSSRCLEAPPGVS